LACASASPVLGNSLSADPGGVASAARPLVVTADDPANHLVAAPSDFDGVVKLLVTNDSGQTYLASGVLISDGWLLTAAHVLDTNLNAVVDVSAENVTVQFHLFDGANPYTETLGASAVYSHPDWRGDDGGTQASLFGNDLALIWLDASAPAAADRYALYTDSDEVDQTVAILGYGRSGTGDAGDALPSGQKREGLNAYDAVNLFALNHADMPAGTQLNYDFDDTANANDPAGRIYGAAYADAGLGDQEAMAAPGDSGGGSFIWDIATEEWLLAGIHSYGFRFGFAGEFNPDVDGELNSSFGEFAGDTRVSAYTDWISQTMLDSIGDPVPEPGSMAILAVLAGGGGLAAIRRRRAR
jgi:hypothetical protein